MILIALVIGPLLRFLGASFNTKYMFQVFSLVANTTGITEKGYRPTLYIKHQPTSEPIQTTTRHTNTHPRPDTYICAKDRQQQHTGRLEVD